MHKPTTYLANAVVCDLFSLNSTELCSKYGYTLDVNTGRTDEQMKCRCGRRPAGGPQVFDYKRDSSGG
jgi:hypothetical protein